MVDLTNLRNIFHQWSYTASEDVKRFDYELSNLIYKDGQLYWREVGDAQYVNGSLITSLIKDYDEGEIWYTTDLIEHHNGRLDFN